jgi:hypothetical protein
MPAELSPQDKQDLRHAVRRALYARAGAAFTAAMLLPALRRALPFSPSLADAQEACRFVAGLGDAEACEDAYGAAVHYRITSQGTLNHERAEA